MFSKTLIEKFKQIETPFYFYDVELLEKTLSTVKKASEKYNFSVHYALKANSNNRILNLIQKKGFGADCVSGNEVLKAVENGFSPSKIAFAGVGKTDKEIKIGLSAGIFSFNCESIPEIEVINQIAEQEGKLAKIAIRINPNVDSKTHKHITTGLSENKFGVNYEDLPELLKIIKPLKNIQLVGIHFHIGSQITNLSVFKDLCIRINEIQEIFIYQNTEIEHVNVGGGLGISYENPDEDATSRFEEYFKIFADNLKLKQGQTVHFELGRSIIAQTGSLISKVLYVKKGTSKSFLILDAGMNDLIRPALYQAFHKIESLTSAKENTVYDIVGPVCESTDVFVKDFKLPQAQRGDLVAIRSTGAYGEVMASAYNLKDFAKAYYSDILL